MNATRQWVREHPGISGLAVALTVCLLLAAVLRGQLNICRTKADIQHATLARMEHLAKEHDTLKTRIAAGSVRLNRQTHFDISALERIAEKNIRNRISQSRSSSRREMGLVERTISLAFVGVTREQLVKFLKAVEAQDPAIRAKTLRLTLSKGRAGLVDAKVTFSAYEQISTTQK